MADNSENRKLIGSRLRWAREQSGLSQGQVAQRLSVHRPTISQIEAGERNVRIEEIEQFAVLYGVDENWLMKGDDTLKGERDPRIQLAARELSKLKRADLDSILRLIQVLQSEGGKSE